MMDTKEVKFQSKTEATYLGQSSGKARGIQVWGFDDHIEIFPYSSRGVVTGCMIQIPTEDVQGVVDALQPTSVQQILDVLPRSSLSILIGINDHLDAEIERRLKDVPTAEDDTATRS